MTPQEIEDKLASLRKKSELLAHQEAEQDKARVIRSNLSTFYRHEKQDTEKEISRLETRTKFNKAIFDSWASSSFEKGALDLINMRSEAEKYNFDTKDLEEYKEQIRSIRSTCYYLMKDLDNKISLQTTYEKLK